MAIYLIYTTLSCKSANLFIQFERKLYFRLVKSIATLLRFFILAQSTTILLYDNGKTFVNDHYTMYILKLGLFDLVLTSTVYASLYFRIPLHRMQKERSVSDVRSSAKTIAGRWNKDKRLKDDPHEDLMVVCI